MAEMAGGAVFGDVRVQKKQLTPDVTGVRLRYAGKAGAQGLNLGARKHESRLKSFLGGIVPARPAVLGREGAHGRNSSGHGSAV